MTNRAVRHRTYPAPPRKPECNVLDVNSPEFWQEIYEGGRAGWDLSGPTPVFQQLLREEQFAPGKMIVLGAGRGYDARFFARQGFDVTAVDFADEPIEAMRRLDDPQAPVKIVQQDIFTLPHTLDETFDYVLEYTCFCAIDPHRRAEYADLVARLLKPSGLYIDLAFPLDPHSGGPPFSVSVAEIMRLFGERGFKLLQRGLRGESVKQRRGLEELLVWQK